MKKSKMKHKPIIIILSLFLTTCLVIALIAHSNNKNALNALKTDTITMTKRDTITITKPVTKNRYIKEVITDTLVTKDSIRVEVNIPIETKVYKDSTYKAVITGYRASLDTIQVYPIHTITTITNTNTIKSRWSIGIQTGIGYGILNNKADLYLGLGITYRLF